MGARQPAQHRRTRSDTSLRGLLVATMLGCVAWPHAAVLATEAAIASPTTQSASSSGDDTVCRCTHGPNATCPMHQKSKPRPPAGGNSRQWCSGCPDQTAILTGLSIDIGSLPRQRYEALAPTVSAAPLDLRSMPVRDGGPRPSVPPPRA